MNFVLHIIALIGMFIPGVLTYNIVFRRGKIFHFGSMGVSVLVAYVLVITLLASGNFFLAFLAGLFASVIASLFFAWLSLRLEPDGMGVMSLAVHLSFIAVILNWNSVTRGALGIPRIPRLQILNSVSDFALAGVIVSAICIFLVRKIDRSAFGRQLQALAEHEWHAKSLGINQAYVNALSFLMAGIGTTVGSFFFVQYLTFIHPNDYHFSALVFLIMIVIAGNPGSVLGVATSTALLITLKEAIRFVPLEPAYVGPVRLILFGIILFVAILVRRDTVFPKQRTV